MDGYARTEDELFSSCLLNLTWENCYEQVGHDSVQRTGVNYGKKTKQQQQINVDCNEHVVIKYSQTSFK